MPPRRPGHTTTSPGCRDWKRNVGNEGQAPCTPGNKKGRRRGGLFERCGPLSPPTYHISCVLVLLDPDIYQDICPCVDPARYLFASRGSTIWLFQNVLDNCKPLPCGGRSILWPNKQTRNLVLDQTTQAWLATTGAEPKKVWIFRKGGYLKSHSTKEATD